jgi:flagellar hook-basal body complex protein FliE
MVNPLAGTGSALPIASPASPASSTDGAGVFRDLFSRTVQEVQAYQQNAVQSVDSFLSGESENLHTVALATQRAELSFEMFVQVRNKLVQAYQEVMRMQV